MKTKLILLTTLLVVLPRMGVYATDLSDLYQRVKGAVVIINTNERIIIPSREKREVRTEGLGSGVLISGDGKVLTAAHVVQIADQLIVRFENGELIPADVLSSSPAADLALLQLERMPQNPVIAKLGNSDSLQVGEQIFVVGAPYGIGHSLTVGYVSGKHKEQQTAGDALSIDLIQTDAAINQGNSGGPMFNMNGEIVGIVSHILSQSGGFEGIGFAVTVNLAKEILLNQPFFWTGLEGFYLEGPLAYIFNLPQESGLLIQRVAEGSLGARMGLNGGNIIAVIEDHPILLGGDIILEVEGIPLALNRMQEMQDKINSIKPGNSITILVLRGGKIREVTALK